MTSKKSEKSNLEKKSTLFFQMGLVIAMAGLLVAFEWGQTEIETNVLTDLGQTIEVPEDIQITRPEPPKVTPPPTPVEITVIPDENIDIDESPIDFTVDIDVTEFIIPFFEPEPEEDAGPEIFVKVETMPKYMNGDESKFQKHLQQLVVYPELAVETGIQGKVFVNFVVDKEGNLTNPTIVRSPDDILSNAVLKAIKKTKKWKPGEQRKRKVPVQFTIPVNFQLQ